MTSSVGALVALGVGDEAGTFSKSYEFDEHVGRHNVFHMLDKDDCHKKPYPTVQRYFAAKRLDGKCCSTFDYKPETLTDACPDP